VAPPAVEEEAPQVIDLLYALKKRRAMAAMSSKIAASAMGAMRRIPFAYVYLPELTAYHRSG